MNKYYSVLILIIFLKLSAISQTIESSGSGNWSDGSSWVGGIVPTNSNSVLINTGHIITIQANREVYSIEIESGAELIISRAVTVEFKHSSGSNSIRTDLLNNGLVSTPDGASTIKIFGKVYFSGSGIFNNRVRFNCPSYLYFTDNCNLTLNNILSCTGGSEVTIESGSKLTLNGESVFRLASLKNYGTLELTNENFCTKDKFGNGNNSNTVLRNFDGSTVIYNYLGTVLLPTKILISGSYYSHFCNIEINNTCSLDSDIDIFGNLVVNGTLSHSNTGNTIKFIGNSQATFSGTGTANLKNVNSSTNLGLNLTCSNINIEEMLYNENSSTITNTSSNLILKSESNHSAGMLKVGSSSEFNGTLTVERYFSIDNTSFGGWVNIASPIKNTTLSGLADSTNILLCGDFTGADVPHYNCGNFTSLYFYDETSALGNFENGWKSASDIIPTYDASTLLNIDDAPFIWSGPNANKISITGSPELDNFTSTLNITNTGGHLTQDGWNLISNPYPCSIDWSLFLARNSSLGNIAYSYSPSNTQWNSISAGGSIPHSQSFFVQTNASTTIDFNLADLSSAYDATYARSSNGVNNPLIIKINNDVNNYTDEIYLNSGANFTEGYDLGFDVGKILTPNPDYAPNIYFLDSSSHKLCHNYINNNLSLSIPIGVNIGNYAQGNYKLSFYNLPEFMIGSCITLEDLHNGVITDLRQDSVYTFFSDSSISVSPRFNLNINVAYDIEVTNSTCYNDSSARIKLSGNNIIGSYFKLLNSSGLTFDSIVAVSDTIIFNNLNSGLYNFVTNDSSNCSIENHNIIISSPQEILADFIYLNDTLYVDSSGLLEVFFNNQSQASNYYFWDFGDGTTSNLKNPSKIFSPGIYDITLIASNDSLFTCNSTVIKSINVLDSSSLILNENPNYEINFEILNKNLILSFNNISNLNDNYIDIFDISGKLIISKRFQVFNNRSKVPLSEISNGIYIFKIFGESFKFLIN